MRPTPETDAFSVEIKTVCGSKKWVPVDLSRRLERERDEARRLLGPPLSVAISERNDALHALTGWENKWKAAVEMAAKAELERDQLRCEIDDLHQQIAAVNRRLREP